jgi:NhaA family Na+:H+ antiporter
MTPAALLEPLTLGIALGLVAGKLIGVFGTSYIAIRSGLADMPVNATWSHLFGVALLCGIGFTMSLFIGLLAFAGNEALQDGVKVGILAGSVAAAILGAAVLMICPRIPSEPAAD